MPAESAGDASVEATVRLTFPETYRAHLATAYSGPLMRGVAAVGLPVAVYVAAWAISPDNVSHPILEAYAGGPARFLAALVAAVALVALLLSPVATLLLALRNLRATPALRREARYAFTRDGFTTATDGADDHTPWGTLHRALETRDAFLLLPSKNRVLVVPKRCLSRGGDAAALRVLLWERLGKRARLHRRAGRDRRA